MMIAARDVGMYVYRYLYNINVAVLFVKLGIAEHD
jgi:hypothetical protein